VQYAVLEAMTRVYENTENSTPPRKYKMDKDIQTPPRIYDYVAELSCCAKSEQNRLTQFCWGNRGSLSFFTHTHNQSVKQILSSRLQITNIEGSEAFMAQNAWFHAQMCLFWGIVDDKSCLGVQIPQKPILGTIQSKTYYRESTP